MIDTTIWMLTFGSTLAVIIAYRTGYRRGFMKAAVGPDDWAKTWKPCGPSAATGGGATSLTASSSSVVSEGGSIHFPDGTVVRNDPDAEGSAG